MRFFASSFGSVDVSRFDGKDKKLWPTDQGEFFHFCRCINLPVFCQCRIFVYSFVTGNGVGQETRWFGCKRRADRWSIELTTNRFVSFQFDTFLFNLHWIRIGCFILEHIVCNAILWCPMGLRVTQVCRTQHVLAAHAYCLQLLRKYICWKCWDVFMDEITSYVLLKLLPTRICRI